MPNPDGALLGGRNRAIQDGRISSAMNFSSLRLVRNGLAPWAPTEQRLELAPLVEVCSRVQSNV